MSSANRSIEYSPGFGSVERPLPRRSTAIAVRTFATPASWPIHIVRSNGKPCTNTATGPEPRSSYASSMGSGIFVHLRWLYAGRAASIRERRRPSFPRLRREFLHELHRGGILRPGTHLDP